MGFTDFQLQSTRKFFSSSITEYKNNRSQTTAETHGTRKETTQAAFSILGDYTNLSQSIHMCGPVMCLALFLCLGYITNIDKDPSFHSGQGKREPNLEKTGNKHMK